MKETPRRSDFVDYIGSDHSVCDRFFCFIDPNPPHRETADVGVDFLRLCGGHYHRVDRSYSLSPSEQNTTATLVGMVIWGLLPILLAFLSLHSVWFRKVVEGEATVVIENGKIMEENLARIRLSIDDLLSSLRAKKCVNVTDVEFALFEANGKLSIQLKSQRLPLTPSDLNLPTRYEGLPTTIIDDGKVLQDALQSLQLSQAWLRYQLEKEHIKDFATVALAQLDTLGNLYVDLKQDQRYYIIPTNS